MPGVCGLGGFLVRRLADFQVRRRGCFGVHDYAALFRQFDYQVGAVLRAAGSLLFRKIAVVGHSGQFHHAVQL